MEDKDMQVGVDVGHELSIDSLRSSVDIEARAETSVHFFGFVRRV